MHMYMYMHFIQMPKYCTSGADLEGFTQHGFSTARDSPTTPRPQSGMLCLKLDVVLSGLVEFAKYFRACLMFFLEAQFMLCLEVHGMTKIVMFAMVMLRLLI